MKDRLNKKMELVLLIIGILPLIALLILGDKVSDQVPLHWNIKGEIDDYGSKWLTPILTLGLYLLFLLIMFIDPKKDNYEKFISLLYKLRLILSLFFSMIAGITIYIGMGNTFEMDRFLLVSIPLLFCFLGNVIINIKPNWFIGVRTPWTMENENVWRKTHRLTGILWFWGGLLLGIIGFFIPKIIGFILLLSIIFILVIVPIVFSYLLFKNETKVINKKDS